MLRLCERFSCLPSALDRESTRLLRLVALDRAVQDAYTAGAEAAAGREGLTALG